MQWLDNLTVYLYVILGTTLGITALVIILVIYFLKVKKIAADEEQIDYSRFIRTDATEFVKFKDIITSGASGDMSAPGMIAIDKYTFVGGIDVRGYNFYGASEDERETTMINTIAFFNTVEQPIQMRQTSRAIDIEYNIKEMEKNAAKTEEALISKEEEYNVSVSFLDNEDVLDNDEVYDALIKRLDRLKKEIGSLKWQLDEAKTMVRYMTSLSKTSSNLKKVNQIMFTYKYNPDEQVEELSEEEIYDKAMTELKNKGQQFGGALESCGCSWSMLSAEDLTDLLRRYYHPVTGDELRISTILNSSYTSLYVSGDDLREIEYQKLGRQQYEQFQSELEKEAAEAQKRASENLKKAKELVEKEAQMLYEQAKSKAREEKKGVA